MRLIKGLKFFNIAVLPGRHKSARFISVIAALILIIIITLILFVPIERKFVVVEKKSGKILFYTDIKPKDTFTITYTHSVNKSQVDDVLEVQSDYSLILKKTVFRAFGVGIPSELNEGEKLNVYPDRTEIDNINRPIKECLVFVGVIADHRFSIHGRLLHLNELTMPQQTVQFVVRRLPIYLLVRGY